jgi:hypothetical protein
MISNHKKFAFHAKKGLQMTQAQLFSTAQTAAKLK